jgi:hypothetical protein
VDSEEQRQAVRTIVERFWKDIASLPWQDQGWVNNALAVEQTRQHYVEATINDLEQIGETKTNDKEEKDLESGTSSEASGGTSPSSS